MKALMHELSIAATVAIAVSFVLVAAINGIGHKSSDQRALISKHRVQSPLATLP